MNMRKNVGKDPENRVFSPLTKRVLHGGLVLIYASLFRLIFEITAAAPFTAAAAEDFGRMLEFPAAALMLLTASTYLLERVMRQENT